MRSYLELTRDEQDHALALHRESIVLDASIVPFIDPIGEDIWISDVLEGGVTATNATVCMQSNLSEAMRELTSYHDWVELNRSKALIVRKASDVEKAKKEGKHGIIFGPQNSSFLERNVRFLDTAWDMGVRIIQISYSERNEAADGCSERTDSGLSNFGVKLVEAINRKGMLIDLSHVGDHSTMEVIELSKAPVSFTHVCPRAITPNNPAKGAWFNEFAVRRGRTDEALKACAEKGGVIGITPYFAKKAGPSTMTDDTMEQINYAVNLVGVDHIGFGSDLDFRNSVTRAAYISKHPDRIDRTYFTAMPKEWGYGWLQYMPNFTKALVANEYSESEIKKILGLNFVNLFKRVWGE